MGAIATSCYASHSGYESTVAVKENHMMIFVPMDKQSPDLSNFCNQALQTGYLIVCLDASWTPDKKKWIQEPACVD